MTRVETRSAAIRSVGELAVAVGGGALADRGQRRVGAVAEDALEPVGRNGALDDADVRKRRGRRMDELQPSGGRQVAAVEERTAEGRRPMLPNLSVSASSVSGDRSDVGAAEQLERDAALVARNQASATRSEIDSRMTIAVSMARLAVTDQRDQVDVEERRRVLCDGT